MKKKLICLVLSAITISQIGVTTVKADELAYVSGRNVFENNINIKAVTGQDVVNEAMKYLGYNYVWEGDEPSDGGFDCSGLTQYVYKRLGISISRTTFNQIKDGRGVSQSELQPGDLVFTHIGHVGIYIGNGQMIHSPQTGDVVKISSIYNFYAARRIVENAGNLGNPGFDTALWNPDIGFVAGAVIGLKPEATQGLGSNTPHYGFPASWHYPTTHTVLWEGIYSGSHEIAIGDTYVPINKVVGVNNINIWYPIYKDRQPYFSESYYLASHPDVVEAIKNKVFVSGYSHYILNGRYEQGRVTTPPIPSDFNDANYLRLNPDVVSAGYTSGLAHYITYGYAENRNW